MPLTATIQKKKKPSAPSWVSGLSAGLNSRSKGRSITSKAYLRAVRTRAITRASAHLAPGPGLSCPHRPAPFAQQQSAKHQQRKARDHAAEHQSIVDAVATRAGIVGRANESDPVDEAHYGKGRGRSVDDILERLDEHLHREIVAVDLSIDAT